MSRERIFGFRVNTTESNMFESLAQRLNRSQSDAIRFVIREAVFALGDHSNNQNQNSIKEVTNDNKRKTPPCWAGMDKG